MSAHDEANAAVSAKILREAGRNQVTLTLTQDQAEHVLLCARMALAQATLEWLRMEGEQPLETYEKMTTRKNMFAALVDVLQKQIIER